MNTSSTETLNNIKFLLVNNAQNTTMRGVDPVAI